MKLLVSFIFLSACLLHADDLTTRDGKVYKGYKVLSHDAGFITILYADGGGKIALSNLPDALQKQYGYDPTQAAVAVKAADEQWKESHAQLRAEGDAAAAQQQHSGATDAAPSVTSSSSSTSAKPIATTVPRPASAPVNAVAAQAQLADDQVKLDGLNEDLAIAEKQLDREESMPYGDNHSDDSGAFHPNHVGVSTKQRIKDLEVSIAALQQEMVELNVQIHPAARVANNRQSHVSFTNAGIPITYDGIVALYGHPFFSATEGHPAGGWESGAHGTQFDFNGIDITIAEGGKWPIRFVNFSRRNAFSSFEITDLLKGLSPSEDWMQKDAQTWTLPKAGATAVWDGAGHLNVTSCDAAR